MPITKKGRPTKKTDKGITKKGTPAKKPKKVIKRKKLYLV